ncbi:DUF1801 domain-containing protein [Flavobacterium sp. NRK1]|uniref:DUF1801 domain-containing protein n=1 Tax=Flavobacterium sp. NRK1 TaxID=2954929 RepID=UPI002093ED6D|nr:DUF1801 domain-containing protein [Flavobacterium sp. NRK1]MCO6149024.1 DUF1801 domain-containing protein [Flavobacterium sp. NRK1]
MMPEKLNPAEEVIEFIKTSRHPLSDVMLAIRNTILNTDDLISEHIKWNAPAFYYNGEMAAFNAKEYRRDIVVYNIRKDDHILLIFPTGDVIEDTIGILEGNYTDGRRMITIKSMEDFTKKKEALQAVIKKWLDKVEK